MRVIKYYDRIHKQLIDLEVTDEVAKFLFSNDKWLRRKQNQYDYYTVSIDKPLYQSFEDDEYFTLADTLAEVKNDDEHVEIYSKQKLQLFQIVRDIVRKLNQNQQELIHKIFFEHKKQKEIAIELNTTKENISQLKQTALLHLRYLFYTNKEFMKTDLYKRVKREYDCDLIKTVKELDNENGLKFNLNNIHDLVKGNTQILKAVSSLGIVLDEQQKALFTTMNRVVKQTLDKFDLDWSKLNTITIPKGLSLPDELKRKQ